MSLLRYRSRLLHVPALNAGRIKQFIPSDEWWYEHDAPTCALFTDEEILYLSEQHDGQNLHLLPAKFGEGGFAYTLCGLPPRSWRVVNKLLEEVLTQEEREQLKFAVYWGVTDVNIGTRIIEIPRHRLSLFNTPLRRSFASNVSMGFPVDVAEESGRYLVQAALPGVSPEAIEITVEGRTLTIATEEDKAQDGEGANYTWRERMRGAWQRSFRLPQAVDTDGVEAEIDQGILTVSIPKSEVAKPRQIEVKTTDS